MDRKHKDTSWCIAGTCVWVSVVILWIVLWFFNPYASPDEAITIPGLVMILVAIFGICASVKRSGIAQLLASLVSVLPIGLYLLGSPSGFAFIGVLNIAALFPAGYFLVFGRRTQLRNSVENR